MLQCISLFLPTQTLFRTSETIVEAVLLERPANTNLTDLLFALNLV